MLDENLNPRFRSALLHRDPTIDVLQIGDAETLPRGTLDPDILKYLEYNQRALVTDNRRSMPGHIMEHFAVVVTIGAFSCSCKPRFRLGKSR
ncbi:MAG: DUF5615 family PIN-like protein, partial [Chloroflexota bacterium]|nr:DUF5615 family PIN-like protein [Chloroflexota bacterium]